MNIIEVRKITEGINHNLPGIYLIYSIQTGRIYVGQTNRLIRRKWEHLSQLKNKNHGNVHLSRIYEKYGAEDLEFLFVENCEKENLNKKEVEWYLKFEKEILINEGTVGQHIPPSKETIEKIRLKNLGRKMSEEQKQKFSLARKGKPNYKNRGRKVSEEHKRHLSELNKGKSFFKGKLHTEESKQKMRKARAKISSSGMKGKFHTEEAKTLIREARAKQVMKPVSEETKLKLSVVNKAKRAITAKLSIEDVKQIKNRLKGKETSKYLGLEFGVSRGTISDIKCGRTWKDVE